jgi:protein-tyrosine phosphatase
VIDLHSHILPGIDDGPATIEGSVAMARAAAASGTRTIVATPHASSRYPNNADTIARLVGELNERLASEAVALEVRSGAEIAIATIVNIDPVQLPRRGRGGSASASRRFCESSSAAAIAWCSPIRSDVRPSTRTRRCSDH